MKILVIDDDVHITDFLQAHLPARGFAVDVGRTGARGIALARVNEYDLVVLDLNLPDMSGTEVCVALREGVRGMPILMLSVIGDSATKTRLLDAGADDYLGKPFCFDELVARMRALLRRPSAIVPDVLHAKGVALDAHAQSARRGVQKLSLTPKEFALLEFLMRRRGSVVSKESLLEHVWDSQVNIFSASVDTHMANLRRKLGRPALIHTIRGKGYRISAREDL